MGCSRPPSAANTYSEEELNRQQVMLNAQHFRSASEDPHAGPFLRQVAVDHLRLHQAHYLELCMGLIANTINRSIHSFRGKPFTREDLVQELRQKCLEAARLYDPDRAASITFLIRVLRSHLTDYLHRKSGAIIDIPSRPSKAYSAFSRKHKRKARGIEELVTMGFLSAERGQAIRRARAVVTGHPSRAASEREENPDVLETLVNTSEQNVDTTNLLESVNRCLAEIGTDDPQTAAVVAKHLGIENGTLTGTIVSRKKLADHFGVTKTRIHGFLTRGLARLREDLQA